MPPRGRSPRAGWGWGVPGWRERAADGGRAGWRGPGLPSAMRRSSTDESTYRRSPSPEGKEPGFARGGPFRRCSSQYGRGDAGDASSGAFFGLHANPGPKAAQARYTSPKGNKYVVFYLDLSFIFLLELKRCSMARGCLQGVKYLMFAFNLLFWVSAGPSGRAQGLGRPGWGSPGAGLDRRRRLSATGLFLYLCCPGGRVPRAVPSSAETRCACTCAPDRASPVHCASPGLGFRS